MVLTTLPLPPLPMLVHQINLNPDKEIEYANSHDFIATLMQQKLSSPFKNHGANDMIATKTELFNKLFAALDNAFSVFSKEPTTNEKTLHADVYHIFTSFSRDYMKLYLPPDSPMDIRFKPYDEIDPKSRLFTQTCDYLIGMSTVSQIDVPSEETLRTKSYIELLFLAAWKLTNIE